MTATLPKLTLAGLFHGWLYKMTPPPPPPPLRLQSGLTEVFLSLDRKHRKGLEVSNA